MSVEGVGDACLILVFVLAKVAGGGEPARDGEIEHDTPFGAVLVCCYLDRMRGGDELLCDGD